jgi:Pyridoxamine 5'-phosphate oxidase
VATWADLETADPELAAAGAALFRAFTVGYLATIRPDGSPRIHPVTVTLHDGGLFVNAQAGTFKAADLERDGRFALHSFPRAWTADSWDDEDFQVAGRVRLVEGAERRAAVRAVHNDAIAEDDRLFELLPERAFHKSRPEGQLSHRTWRDPEATARPSTGARS